MYLLLGLVEEGLVISEIGDDVLGEIVLDNCKVRNDWVDLLRSCLPGHDSEFVLLFGHWPPTFSHCIGLWSYVKLGVLSAAGLMGKRFPSLELLLEAVLVEALQLLQSLSDTVRLPRHFWLLCLLCLLWFSLRTSRIGQIVEMLIINCLRIALQFHLPADYFFEILPVILRLLLF